MLTINRSLVRTVLSNNHSYAVIERKSQSTVHSSCDPDAPTFERSAQKEAANTIGFTVDGTAKNTCDASNPKRSRTRKFPALNIVDNSTQKLTSKDYADLDTLEGAAAKAALKTHSLSAWGATNPFFDNIAIHVSKSEGIYLYDENGKRFIDWSSGAVCNNLGHTMPQSIKDAAMKQLNTVPFVYGDLYTHDARAKLTHLLAKITPANISHFLLSSSGAEANESAIRLARVYTGKNKILTRHRSYHGATNVTLAATGDSRNWISNSTGSQPGMVKIQDPCPTMHDWGNIDPDVAVELCLDVLHEQIIHEGPNNIAAIMLEPITGTNGWLLPSKKWLQGVRALCDKYEMLLICDEVMAGMGRTGKWFSHQHYDGVTCDIMSFAKGISGSWCPTSGIGVSKKLAEYFADKPTCYGSTFTFHPLSCAISYETLKYMIDNDIIGNVLKMEKVQAREMAKLAQWHLSIKEARTIGLGGGFDLANPNTGEYLCGMHETHPGINVLKNALKENGINTFIRGHHVHCCPPLIIQEHEIVDAYRRIDKALLALDQYLMK